MNQLTFYVIVHGVLCTKLKDRLSIGSEGIENKIFQNHNFRILIYKGTIL